MKAFLFGLLALAAFAFAQPAQSTRVHNDIAIVEMPNEVSCYGVDYLKPVEFSPELIYMAKINPIHNTPFKFLVKQSVRIVKADFKIGWQGVL